jgi:lycopene cyclase domain-containing protein
VWRMEYFLILLFWLIVSAAIQYRYHVKLYRNVKQMVVTAGFYLIVGITWDIIGATRGHWTFQYENLMGIRLGVLPFEELLFMLIVPYGILVFYKFCDMKIN